MLLLTPILLIAVVLYVAYPLLSESQPDETESERKASRREALQAEKDNLIASLKDIEMDYRMEKLSDTDYQRLKTEFEHRAIGIMRKLDKIEKSAAKNQAKLKPHRLKKA